MSRKGSRDRPPGPADASGRREAETARSRISPISAPVALSAGAAGAFAVGAASLFTFGIGMVAIGWLTIGFVAVKRARIGSLEIDELIVRRLKVLDDDREFANGAER